MEQTNQRAQLWLDAATRGIRFKPDRRAVAAELRAHLEDKTDDLRRIFPDMTAEEAEARVLDEMGDPAEIGSALARIHKPWLGYLWRVSQVLVTVCLGLALAVFVRYGEDAFLGDDPYSELWDWDSLPTTYHGELDGVNTDAAAEKLYLPGEDPEQLQVWEDGPKARPVDQTVRVRWAALWQEGEEQVLYCYLRVETWRFWERGTLRPEWLTVTDSLGNQYARAFLEEEAGESPSFQFSGQAGYGPFHRGFELRVRNVAPGAEWVRLDYGEGGGIFSLVLDRKEGTV